MREHSKNPVWPWQYNGGVVYEEWHAIDYWMKQNPGRVIPVGEKKKMDFSNITERFKE